MDRLRTVRLLCMGLLLAISASGCATYEATSGEISSSSSSPPTHATAPPQVSIPTPPAAAVPPEAVPPVSEPRAKLYKVWYATNRLPVLVKNEVVGYSQQRDAQRSHYGTLYAEIPADFMAERASMSFLRRLFPTAEAKLRLTKPVQVSAAAFVDQLKNAMRAEGANERPLLIYLHGFNTTFNEAAQRAASIGYQLKMPVTAFFSWPSQGGMMKYLADKDLAEISEDSIADFIVKATAEAGATKVHLIAHSMGNHALLNAMYRPRMQRAIRDGLRFGQIILAAPDVDTDKFIRDAGIFATVADRVSLYVSDGDQALNLSRRIAANRTRAGLRPPVVVVKNIDTVDVSSTNLTALGHAFISQEIAVLNDMHSLINHNTPPAKRIRIFRKDNYWALQ